MATRKAIEACLGKLRFLPNCPLTDKNLDEVVDTFELALSDIPAEMLEIATTQYLSTKTFWPAPGDLRNTAMDLIMLAMGIPTPTEAWGSVIHAEQWVEAVFCEEGVKLNNAANIFPEKYMDAISACIEHERNCDICKPTHIELIYSHPVIGETVRMLGGRDILLTDNSTADRARFIDAYREIVSRERTKQAMTPQVRGFIENGKVKELMYGLAKRLEAK